MYTSGLQVVVVVRTDGQILMTAPYQVRVVTRQKDMAPKGKLMAFWWLQAPGWQCDSRRIYARAQILLLP